MCQGFILSNDLFEELVEAIGQAKVGSLFEPCSRCGQAALWRPDRHWSYCLRCREELGDYFARFEHVWGKIERI
jgi:hypothetical protein